ncbi:hypothetical protein HAX54_032460 [Datura stramonium]|uniref:Uncharacterized protein n=1 Tax=Datura stramonium TaxID=4076 RepID=A0ABS8VBP2_DATST|nr:hypothetical protein [Datura stramonium]
MELMKIWKKYGTEWSDKEGRLTIKMERGSAYMFEETKKFLLEEIEKIGEEIAMTRRKIEQIDHNRDNLLVKIEEVDLQIDWVERRIAEIDLDIAESLKDLCKVPLPARKEISKEIERLLHKFADITKMLHPINSRHVDGLFACWLRVFECHTC